MLNEFKSKLENGEFVYGVFVKTSDPMFNEIIGISGYDYVILDTEHGPTDIENQQNNIRACELRGILPIVRVPYIDDNVIGKALDIGAMGIQISQIRCAEDVKKVIKYAKFYPEGERGVCRFVRAADYSSLNIYNYGIFNQRETYDCRSSRNDRLQYGSNSYDDETHSEYLSI